MLIRDETIQLRQAIAHQRETQLEHVARRYASESEASRLVGNEDAIADPQRGTPLRHDQFELKLLKLHNKFAFIDGETHKKVVLLLPNGEGLDLGIVYPKGKMPEFSGMNIRTIEIPDRFTATTSQTTVDRKDLPKHEWVPHGKNPHNGYWVVPSGEPLPGIVRMPRPWDEERGWRTVLYRVWKDGVDSGRNYFTLEDINREFGPCNRRSWVILTGQQEMPILI